VQIIDNFLDKSDFNILEEYNSKALSNKGKSTDESFNINQLTSP
jgi:hypothetical protein